MCSRGCRAFCDQHGLDWVQFVHEGIPVSELEHIDDSMLQEVLRLVETEEITHGQQ